MATSPSLPSASSVVDFLKTQGKDSSFGARKKMYTESGLNTRLGDYVGSTDQNVAFLKQLSGGVKSASVASAPTPGVSSLSALGLNPSAPKTSVPPGAPLSSTLNTLLGFGAPKPAANPVMDAAKLGAEANAVAERGGGQFVPNDASGYGGKSVFNPAYVKEGYYAGAPATDTKVVSESVPTAKEYGGSAPVSSKSNDTTTKETLGVSASDIYPDVFGNSDNSSEADLVNQWLNSSEGQLFAERQKLKGMDAEAAALEAKQKLEAKYESDKVSLEQKLASNGLAFSGVRATQVKALADELASSELGVDREFASKLLDANLDLRDAILDGVAEIAKDAKEGRKEAISQLNAIGYAVVGNQLVKTLAARKEERVASEGGSGGSGNKLTWSEATSRGLPLSLVGQSEEDIIGSLYSPEPPDWFIQKVEEEGQQNYTPEQLRKLWAASSSEYLDATEASSEVKKATSYFQGSYSDSLTAEEIRTAAQKVELLVNGGATYADAVAEIDDVIKRALQ